MSARRDDLIALLAKVKAGDGNDPSDYLCLMIVDDSIAARNAYNGDLNAAKALHEAVLHERVTKYEVWSMRYGGSVELRDKSDVLGAGTDVESNPARAWLIAILKALIAEAQPAPHRRENHK